MGSSARDHARSYLLERGIPVASVYMIIARADGELIHYTAPDHSARSIHVRLTRLVEGWPGWDESPPT